MKRVLVVEDEVDSREMMAMLLEGEGYTVVTAENGRDGLGRLREAPVDLIVTDVMMPFMSGEEMLARIHRDEALRAIPVIVVSAGDGAPVAYRFECAFYRKPVDVDALLQTVRRLIGP